MKLIGIILIIVTLAGCSIRPPQSRLEFTTAVAKGTRFTKVHNFEVSKSFKYVVNNLNSKSKKCLSKTIQHSGYGISPSSITYNPTIRVTGKGKAEFTMQVIHSPRGTAIVPPGGIYSIAVDIAKISKYKTKILIYAPSFGFDNIVSSIKSWSKGITVECPDLK